MNISNFLVLLIFGPAIGFSTTSGSASLNTTIQEFERNQSAAIDCDKIQVEFEFDDCLGLALEQAEGSLKKQLTNQQFQCWNTQLEELCSGTIPPYRTYNIGRLLNSCMLIYDLRLAGVLISRDTNTQTSTSQLLEKFLGDSRSFQINELERHMQGLYQQKDPNKPVNMCASFPTS